MLEFPPANNCVWQWSLLGTKVPLLSGFPAIAKNIINIYFLLK
jgi:hypothetical protein